MDTRGLLDELPFRGDLARVKKNAVYCLESDSRCWHLIV